jgi:hypothetical protein
MFIFRTSVPSNTHHTIIFVSHDNGIVQLFFAQYECSRIILTLSLLLGALFKLGDNETVRIITISPQ